MSYKIIKDQKWYYRLIPNDKTKKSRPLFLDIAKNSIKWPKLLVCFTPDEKQRFFTVFNNVIEYYKYQLLFPETK